jgi:hypothetical protein
VTEQTPQAPQQPPPAPRPEPPRPRYGGEAKLITNALKVVGAYVFIKEQAQPGPAQDSVLLVASLFVLGVQFAETALMALLDRFFGDKK